MVTDEDETSPVPLDGIEIASGIVVVHVSFLDLLGQLPLAFAGLLRTLQLESVLIHREPHRLPASQQPEQRVGKGMGNRGQTLTLSSCRLKHARIRSWKTSPGSRVA